MIRKYLMIAILAVCQICAYGEGRVYTRKARLEDFPSRTTRVVLTGGQMFDIVLKEEISSRWMVSPL